MGKEKEKGKEKKKKGKEKKKKGKKKKNKGKENEENGQWKRKKEKKGVSTNGKLSISYGSDEYDPLLSSHSVFIKGEKEKSC